MSPPAAATALNAYPMFLTCDRMWRKIGDGIRELAFAGCLEEQKASGVADPELQTANCNEVYAILERD